MKRKFLFIVLALTVIAAVVVYNTIYREHRQIESEEVEYTTTVSSIQQEYLSNPVAANAKYADKTIVVSGKITAFDGTANTIIVDGKLSASLQNTSEKIPTPGSSIQIKGRFVGYDDLLEELKMDQVTLLNSN